ncbi:probable aspartic proteinase GIP2 [Primulina huaijiensis]|uniref:probable aspartic proteinase GIP2 n=1 Tax=Primulina huaijiensis TaxID=1492673 RepID=UPI003CC79701
MASFLKFLLLLPLISHIHGAISQKYPTLPKAAVLPLTKDISTLQYVTELLIGENLAPVKLVVDLGGPFLWVDSEFTSQFSSPGPVKSCSLQCSMVEISGCSRSCGLGYNASKTCTLQVENSVSRISTSGEMKEDIVGVKFSDAVDRGSFAYIQRFLFSHAPNLLLEGLASGAKGMLGLGNSRISLPSQFSTTFGFFHRKFSLCLSPSNGAIFLGGMPPELENEPTIPMMYTPLISKKSNIQQGYYINVNSIKISGKKLSLNPKGSVGRTKISTAIPYTTMESKIYSTFNAAYIKAATSMNLSLVAPVAPFEVCFSPNEGGNKRTLPNFPTVDLVMQSELVKWRILGRNLMVRVSDEVMCLGFLNGGLNPMVPIVVGGYQLEDYMLEFNLGNSMLGFSSPLGMVEKKCSDFDAYSWYTMVS